MQKAEGRRQNEEELRSPKTFSLKRARRRETCRTLLDPE